MRTKVGESDLFFDIEGPKEVVEAGARREKATLILLHGAPGLSDHRAFKPAFSALSDVAHLVYSKGLARREGFGPPTLRFEA